MLVHVFEHGLKGGGLRPKLQVEIVSHSMLHYYHYLLQGQGWQDSGGEEQLRQESPEQRDHHSYTGQWQLFRSPPLSESVKMIIASLILSG